MLALLIGLLLALSLAARADAAITWSGAQVHPHWGYETDASISQELQSIGDAGGNSLRMDIPWDAYEGAGDNQWDQSYLDRVGGWVTQAQSFGIRPIITLTGTPRWAAHAACPYDPTPTSYDWLQCSPANAAAYGDAAARIASQPWGQYLLGIEVWNEPNWQPTGDTNPEHGTLRSPDDAQAEVDMTKAAYAAVKAVRPSLQVITGSIYGADGAFLRSMYQKGLGQSFDVVAMHPYNGNRPPGGTDPINGRASTNPWGDTEHTDWIDGAGRMRAAMQAGGDGTKPIWFTEWGWSTCPTATHPENTSVTQAKQTRSVTTAYDTIRTSLPYVTGAFVYQLRDPPLASVGNNEREGRYGLIRTDFTAKPAYGAWRNVMDITAPTAPTGVTAVAGNGKVTLSWNAVSASDLKNYRVYRRNADGTWP
ncbi:MAG: cellulase family glycosylhydrolase, partial [Thermoleophilaceae bacterium]